MAYNFVFLDYRLCGSTVDEVMSCARNFVENELAERIEHCSISVLNKAIQACKLKKEFLSFAKEHDNDEKELLVLFIRKRASELMHNVDKWAKIFITEKEDRTNKRHRKHIKEMLPYLKEIGKIGLLFVQKEKQTFASLSSNTIRKGLNGNFDRECYKQQIPVWR